MMSKIAPLGAILACMVGFAHCPPPTPWDDPSEHYLQRTDTITVGAGDAKEVNAATHMIDPWPRHVRNRRIPASGERMVGAVERYRDVSKLPLAPKPIESETSGFTPGSSGGR